MYDKTISANIDGEHMGSVHVDQWTANEQNDTVWLACSISRATLSIYMTKEQARELADALMQIVEAE